MTAPIIENTYTGDGSTVLFSFTFEYIETVDVEVSIDNVTVPTTSYSLANSTTIEFNTAPAVGAAIRIYRNTTVTDPKATFFPGSAIRAQDLNDNFEQILFVTQEADAIAERAETAADQAQIATAAAQAASASATAAANQAQSQVNAAQAAAAAAAADANTATTDAATAVTTANAATATANQASTDAAAAATNAASAANSATTAQTAATAAQTAATNAQAQAASASSSAATAASNATNAQSQAQLASTQATAAAGSAATASSDAASAVTTANNASTDASAALTAANNAVSTANSASSTATTADTNATAAVATANTASTNASNAVSTANTAASDAASAVSTANSAQTDATAAVNTANTASSTATTADTNASTALSTANTAASDATNAVSTANSASTAAANAVTTANTAATDASNAVNTANTAATNAASAVSTANTAASDASTALSTANTADTNATAAVSTANSASSSSTTAVNTANGAATTANSASTDASTALSTANTAATNASNAVSTANQASTDASTAISNASTAQTTANSAVTTANAASTTANNAASLAQTAANTVASSYLFSPVAAVANIPSNPSNNDAVRVVNSTNIESTSSVQGVPTGFVGDSGINVEIIYSSSASKWNYIAYNANDPDDRYGCPPYVDVTRQNTVDAATLSGRPLNSTHLGTFTGSTITDDTTVKQALQDLETEVETKADLVGGVVPTSQLPALAITTFLGSVANQTAMLALSGQRGDFAIRTDTGSTFVLTSDGGSSLSHWQELATPTDAIQTVNGQAGTVVLGATDVGALASGSDATKTSGNLTFNDNLQARFGNSADLRIYHDSNNSYISQVGVGDLYLQTTTDDRDVVIQSDDGAGGLDDYFRADGSSGRTYLYHYGNERFRTDSAGVNVTGNIIVSGTVDGRDVAADGTKLDGIAAGAQVNVSTNLGSSANTTSFTITSSTGNNVTINEATGSEAGAMSSAHHDKLDGIEANATADQTASEIRTLVGSASDSNVFTDALKNKLNAIETNATADQTDAEIRAAVAAASDSNVLTDALLSKLNGIEANATADQTSEEIQDIVGAMVSGNSESGITVTYQDSDGTLDFSVASQTDQNFTTALKNKLDGIASSATNVTNNNQLTNGAGYLTSADGGNAGQLSGLTSSQFLRSDTADTASGDITFSGGGGAVSIAANSDIRLAAGNWTGEAPNNNAKIQAHGNHLYFQVHDTFRFRNGSGSDKLTINNGGNLVAQGNVTAFSDIRLKKDIELIPNALDKVLSLRGVTYTDIESDDRRTGVIAQEVQSVLPEAVQENEEYLSVAYGNLVGLLIESVKELEARVRELEGR